MLTWEVKNMGLTNISCRPCCSVVALIASAIIGIVTAFLQIAGVITLAPVFLWVTFGIAIVYLGGLLVASVVSRRNEQSSCGASALRALLGGILGTVLFSSVLLAVGIVATSVLSAVLVGLLVFFFALTLTSSACFVKRAN